MANTDITFTEFTTGIVAGTGAFDQLMASVKAHLAEEWHAKRLTSETYSGVYVQSIQAAMQTAMQYVLQEKLTEAQIDGINADNLVKAKNLEIQDQSLLMAKEELELKKSEADNEYVKTLAEIDKVYGFDYTLDSDGHIIRDSSLTSNGAGKLDYETNMLAEQTSLVTQQILTESENTNLVKEKIESEDKNNMSDGVIDNQILDIKKSTDIKERQAIIAESELADKLLTTNSDRLLTTAKIDLINEQVETENKQNETNGLIDKQIDKMTEDINIAKADLAIKELESDKEYAETLAKIAKELGFNYTLDANGRIIRDATFISSGKGIIDKELELKQIEADRALNTTEAELEKQWGYNVTRDANNKLVLGASTEQGKIDHEILEITQSTLLKTTQDYVERLNSADKLAMNARVVLDKIPSIMTEFNLDKPVGE